MKKLALAAGLFSLAACQGVETAPPVEPFAAHVGALFPAGMSGQTYVNASAAGFVAYGVADGAIVFAVSGSAGELGSFGATVRRETGVPMVRCQPSPESAIIGPIPCPPGPTGNGGGETQQ